MNAHERTLMLAATAIDFPLDGHERSVLAQHLAECATCRRDSAALATDARTIANLPSPRLAPARLEAIIASVLRRRTERRPVRYLAIAALLALLATGALVVGAEVARRLETSPLLVVVDSPPPSAFATVAPSASAGPSAIPTPTPPPSPVATVPTRPEIGASWTSIAGPEAFGGAADTAVTTIVEANGRLFALTLTADRFDGLRRFWMSEDGATWSEVETDGFLPWALSSDGQRLYGIPSPGEADLRVSEDGRTWRSYPGLDAESHPSGVSSTAKGIFAWGAHVEDAAIWRFDKDRWVRVELPGAAGFVGAQDASPAHVFGVGDLGTDVLAWGEVPAETGFGFAATRFWTSPDGVTWTSVDPAAREATSPRAMVAAPDGVTAVIAGLDVDANGPAAWFRRGGNWEPAAFLGEAAPNGAGQVLDVVELQGTFIGIGYADTPSEAVRLRPVIFGSPDGESWWPITIDGLGRGFIEDVVATADGRIIAIGRTTDAEALDWDSPHAPAVWELVPNP